MAETALKGKTVNTNGDIPAVGETAPDFTLTGRNLKTVRSGDLLGSRVVLNIFPSLDTATCAKSVRVFNEQAAGLDRTAVLCVSADLPFAADRFCDAQDIEGVTTASTFRNPEFLDDYGVRITNGPLTGLCARAVVVIDTDGTVIHSRISPEIVNEPDYEAALASLT